VAQARSFEAAILANEMDFAQQPPRVVFLLSVMLGRVGDRGAEMAKMIRRALTFHPRDFWLCIRLAELTTDAGEASASYRAALAVRPKSAVVYSLLARQLDRQGDSDAALAAFRLSIL